MNIEDFKDKLGALRETLVFIRRGRSPRSVLDRVRHAPYVLREKHILRIIKRRGVRVDPEYIEYIKRVLNGTSDGTEEYPVCDVCNTAFSPDFLADDGFKASATTCAGCLRTQQKEKERTT